MKAARAVHVIGAGGHAKVVVATIRAAGLDVECAWDDDPRRRGGAVLGAPVRGSVDDVPAGVPIVVAIGSNVVRRDVVARLGAREFCTVAHPSAVVHPSATLGPGTVVFAGAVVQPDARLGAHVIVNTAASVDHDCLVEDFVFRENGPLKNLFDGMWFFQADQYAPLADTELMAAMLDFFLALGGDGEPG